MVNSASGLRAPCGLFSCTVDRVARPRSAAGSVHSEPDRAEAEVARLMTAAEARLCRTDAGSGRATYTHLRAARAATSDGGDHARRPRPAAPKVEMYRADLAAALVRDGATAGWVATSGDVTQPSGQPNAQAGRPHPGTAKVGLAATLVRTARTIAQGTCLRIFNCPNPLGRLRGVLGAAFKRSRHPQEVGHPVALGLSTCKDRNRLPTTDGLDPSGMDRPADQASGSSRPTPRKTNRKGKAQATPSAA